MKKKKIASISSWSKEKKEKSQTFTKNIKSEQQGSVEETNFLLTP